MVKLRADPWSPDYGMGFEAAQEEAALPSVDPFIETADWSRPRSPGAVPAGPVWFVDGVRRVEQPLWAEDGGRRVRAIFGSYAVGSVCCDGRATFGEYRVCRALVVGGGVQHDRVEVPCGADVLEFEAVADPRIDPNGPLERLQRLMRDAEEAVVAHVDPEGAPLVLADGPLRLVESRGSSAVGVVKRLVRQYLGPDQEALLGRLSTGQRTPLFALAEQNGTVLGYSWYARIAPLRVAWHDHAALVRCEVRASVGIDAALAVADRVTSLLPGFAGRPADPRSPQNLVPVAGLETWLRHRMGDRAMIRRAVGMWLVDRVLAEEAEGGERGA
jgi:hypothetical protein